MGRFQTTYEELKLLSAGVVGANQKGFQTTYEELKRLSAFYKNGKSYSFQTTYEELKLGRDGATADNSTASRLPMRN